jgi:glycosyltransferase involved in cell wall biosynthesis
MLPRFSIIIPTRNRGALLDRCLVALGGMEYARETFEVLVVDDGSEPPVGEAVGRHSATLAVRCLRTEGVGPAAARNLGLRTAQGEYVAFTDDDCRPGTQWLRAFDAAIGNTHAEQRPSTGLGGRIVDAPENGICGRASQMLVSFLYEYNESSAGLRFFCSNNLVFPRRALLEMGGFDESFPLAAAEDRYICARWLQQGELEFVPEAVVEHRQLLGLRGFVRQQFRYGRGACQFWRRRQTDGAQGNRLEPGQFYRRMLSYPFGRVRWFEAVATAMLLALSQMAVALGYYWERFGPRPQDAGVSPLRMT